MIGLFLDDERNPEDVKWVNYPDGIEWYIVRRMCDFMFTVLHCDFDVISFDHDIQDFNSMGQESTGYDCLKWLADRCIDTGKQLPNCYFHTQNPVGKNNMEQYYKQAKLHTRK